MSATENAPATTAERPPDGVTPLFEFAGLLFWLTELAAVVLTVLALPAFEAMFRDLNQPLPAPTNFVLNAGRLARSPLGIAAGLALVSASILGFWKARRSPIYWCVLGCLMLLAMGWIVLCPLVVFGPLLETIRRIK